MTPEQLSTTIVDVLEALVADGVRDACPTACPTTVTVERPRQKGHGDYATNVAMQLAKKAGMQPARASPSWSRAGSAQADGVAGVEVAGPGFLNITVDAGAQGEVAAADRRRRGGVRRRPTRSPARRSTSSSSPPTRPARSTSAASAGRPSATRSAGSSTMTGAEVTREYYFNDHGAQIDRFSRVAAGQRPGRAGAGGRLRRRVHRTRSPRRSSPSAPDVLGPARRRGAGGLPRRSASSMMFARDQAEPPRLRGRLRRLLPRGQPAQERRRRAGPSSG